MDEDKKSTVRNVIAKILFIIGVIIILILLIFAIVRFVPVIFGGLANVGSSITQFIKGKDNAIDVAVNNSDLVDGEVFALSWDYDTDEKGRYVISYDCTDYAEFSLQRSDDTVKKMLCNTPYEVSGNRVEIIASYEDKDSFEDVAFTVSFIEEGDLTADVSGSTVVTIKNSKSTDDSDDIDDEDDSSDDNSEKDDDIDDEDDSDYGDNMSDNDDNSTITGGPVRQSSPTYTYTNPVYTGRADLAISNIVSYPNQSTVQFTISNIGGQNTGLWQFAYTSPTSPRETLYSQSQISLGSGQSIRYTLSFAAQDEDEEGIVIIADPFDYINEKNESNNSAAVVITGYGTGGNNGGNGRYDPDDDANFEIYNLEVGYISGGRFREDDRLDEGDDAAIRFVVVNTGGERTDDWRFEITDLPYSGGDDDYRSREYNPLRPGEQREFVLEFENIDEGDYDIRVFVDSEDDTDEESESDNRESVDLEVRD